MTITGDTRPTQENKAGLHATVLGVVATAALIGALAIRSSFIYGLVILAAIFVPLERIFALRPQPILRPRWKSDVVHLVVNNLLSTVLIALAVISAGAGLHAAVPDGVRSALARQAPWLQVIEALCIAEMAGYWAHRAAHTVPVLWRFHKVHHSITEMDWLASGRVHPVDQGFTKSCTLLPLFALGFGRGTFGAVLVFFALQALFIHANVRLRFGPLRWLISTPEFHHWHHSSDPAAYNSNFAGEFPWMDMLFGTLHLPKQRMPDGYGIAEPFPDGYVRQLAWPFTAGHVTGAHPRTIAPTSVPVGRRLPTRDRWPSPQSPNGSTP